MEVMVMELRNNAIFWLDMLGVLHLQLSVLRLRPRGLPCVGEAPLPRNTVLRIPTVYDAPRMLMLMLNEIKGKR